MAHYSSVMGKPDIMAFIVHTIQSHGTLGSRIFVDNESTLNINLHSTGVGDSFF